MMIRRFFKGRYAIPPFLPYIMVFFLIYVLSCTPLVAEEEEWRFVYGAEDIKVHKRIRNGSSFFEFKAIGKLHGEINEYISVLLDTDMMPDWAPQCFEAKNIKTINEKEVIIYVACKGVWPVADRDYIAKRTIVPDLKNTTVRINVDLIEYPFVPNNNRIHIPRLECCWILKKIDTANTHVALNAYVDSGGWLPGWIVNWGYRRIPYRYLKNLESEVAKRSNGSSTHFVSVSTLPP